MVEKSPFSKLSHVAVVVRDIDKAVKRLESLGIGPFEAAAKPPNVEGMVFHGKLLEEDPKIFETKIGEMKLEMFEPGKGESPYKEFLDSKGEGIHHIGFDVVDDIEKVVDNLTAKGAEVILSGKANGRLGFVYLDLGVGDIIVEFEQK